MTASKAQIAVVEDDSALRELLVEELEAEDYKVCLSINRGLSS